MADVTGPLSTLPGHTCSPPEGSVCDRHPDRVAVKRLQGETDSMGSEQHDLCQACYDSAMAYIRQERESRASTPTYCEWHKGLGLNVAPMRDYEEGMTGRLYDTCSDCRRKVNERAREDLEELHDDFYDDDSGNPWIGRKW